MITIILPDNMSMRISQKDIQIWHGASIKVTNLHPMKAIAILREIDRTDMVDLDGYLEEAKEIQLSNVFPIR